MSPRPFRFALSASNAASGAAWRDLARKAEDLGFSTLHVPDHYVDAGSNGGQALAAIPAMSMAAAVTTTLRVGARVLCVDYHHPAVLAKQAATLDLLSDGRLELGLGAGWVASEYEAMGLSMDPAGVRIDRLAETVAFLDAYFTGEPLDFQGDHVRATGFRGQPRPAQSPRPPLMIGGGARRVLTYAGRVADIVSFNFDNRAGVVGPAGVQSSSAENMDTKIGWVREGAGDRFDAIELEVGAYFTAVTDAAAATAEKMGAMFGLSGEAMADHPNALIGSVDAICERLEHRRARYGFSYVMVSDRNADAFAPVVARLAGT
jgi:probable F420-dependent oxidoreductase